MSDNADKKHYFVQVHMPDGELNTLADDEGVPIRYATEQAAAEAIKQEQSGDQAEDAFFVYAIQSLTDFEAFEQYGLISGEAITQDEIDRSAAIYAAWRAKQPPDQLAAHDIAAEARRRASQLEALTLEAIERDPWNAVTLPLPENPPHDLLRAAHTEAGRCLEACNNRIARPHMGAIMLYEPKHSEGANGMGAEDGAKAALARMHELETLDPSLSPGLMSDFVSPETRDSVTAELSTQSRDRSGRDL